jgi:hypothetical protein
MSIIHKQNNGGYSMKFKWSFIVLLAVVTVLFMVGESVLASSEKVNVTVSLAASDSYLAIDGIKGEIPVMGLSWGDKAPSTGRFDTSDDFFVADSFSIIIEKGEYAEQLKKAINSKSTYALGKLVVDEDTRKEYTFFDLSPTGIKTISSEKGLEAVVFNFVKGK